MMKNIGAYVLRHLGKRNVFTLYGVFLGQTILIIHRLCLTHALRHFNDKIHVYHGIHLDAIQRNSSLLYAAMCVPLIKMETSDDILGSHRQGVSSKFRLWQ